MERLRGFDQHRKVPRDVTEGTVLGGAISVAMAIVLAWLLLDQVFTFLHVGHTTRLYLDRSSQAATGASSGLDGRALMQSTIGLNFNITLKHVPCAYVALDVTDHRGVRRHDRNRQVARLRVDGEGNLLGAYSPPIAEGRLFRKRHGDGSGDGDDTGVPVGTKAEGHAAGRPLAMKRGLPPDAPAYAAGWHLRTCG